MTRDALLLTGSLVSAYLAIERARWVRLLRRAARWPTADRAELGKLTVTYIAESAVYALVATAMLTALAVRHA